MSFEDCAKSENGSCVALNGNSEFEPSDPAILLKLFQALSLTTSSLELQIQINQHVGSPLLFYFEEQTVASLALFLCENIFLKVCFLLFSAEIGASCRICVLCYVQPF